MPPLEEDKIHKGRSNSEPPWKRAIFINGVAIRDVTSKEEKMMISRGRDSRPQVKRREDDDKVNNISLSSLGQSAHGALSMREAKRFSSL